MESFETSIPPILDKNQMYDRSNTKKNRHDIDLFKFLTPEQKISNWI